MSEPTGAAPHVSVIVAARDAEATLPRTLAGLQGQQIDVPFEVIIVDNGSLDETAAVAENHSLKPRVIRRRRGEGAGAARNDGAASAAGSVLAFTDSDCEPDPTWLAEGLRAISGADLVQGSVSAAPDAAVGPYDRTLWVASEYGLYETANLFVRRDWFERLGGFQDLVPDKGKPGRAARPFGEDAWFAWRARRMGARTAFGQNARVYHAVFPGSAYDYIAEGWRLRHFPELVSRIPELRDVFAWRRWFLSSRTAAFDVAVVGVIAAVALRSFLPLAAIAPYAVAVESAVRGAARRRRELIPLAAVNSLRDAVGFLGLLVGSVRARSALL
jgi:glycosyltransferase involved in cell wall biosynthesis